MVQKLRIALSLLEDMALEPPRVRLTRCLINLFEGYGERKAEPSTRVRCQAVVAAPIAVADQLFSKSHCRRWVKSRPK